MKKCGVIYIKILYIYIKPSIYHPFIEFPEMGGIPKMDGLFQGKSQCKMDAIYKGTPILGNHHLGYSKMGYTVYAHFG